jgi:hypothetical protein
VAGGEAGVLGDPVGVWGVVGVLVGVPGGDPGQQVGLGL